jgi:hypothetical protein
LNGATVQGRAIVVNKSEPKPEGERRSFNNNRGGETLVEVTEQQSRWCGDREEDINIFFTYKGINVNDSFSLFWFYKCATNQSPTSLVLYAVAFSN